MHLRSRWAAQAYTERVDSGYWTVYQQIHQYSITCQLLSDFGASRSQVEVKLEIDLHGLTPHWHQLMPYAREIFFQQHNRRFLVCILLTEQHIRVYKIDHSKIVSSRWYHIHNEPEVFVRIILGITSLDEESIGYDTSIFWDRELVPQRWITLTTPKIFIEGHSGRRPLTSEKTLEFMLVGNKPEFSTRNLSGRGTTCWLVEDEDNKKYLLKDCWRSKDCSPEYTFLEAIRGVEGICQIYAYQDGVDVTSYISNPAIPCQVLDRIQYCG